MEAKYKLSPENISAIEQILSSKKDAEVQGRNDGSIVILEIEKTLVAKD